MKTPTRSNDRYEVRLRKKRGGSGVSVGSNKCLSKRRSNFVCKVNATSNATPSLLFPKKTQRSASLVESLDQDQLTETNIVLEDDKVLSLLTYAYEKVNRNESRMYSIDKDIVSQAASSTTARGAKIASKMNAREFQRTLTYGEVEPESISETILPMCGVQSSDVFYDLGCGTGKIVMQVALATGCKASKGIEIVQDRVDEGEIALERLFKKDNDDDLGMILSPHQIVIVQGDLCAPPKEADLTDATVVFINNVLFGPVLMHIVCDLLAKYPNIQRVVTLRKLCARHSDRRCSLKGSGCAEFIHPPTEQRIGVSWADETSAFLYVRKQRL